MIFTESCVQIQIIMDRYLMYAAITLHPKYISSKTGGVKNCQLKNMVNNGPSLSYHDQNYPDYGSRLRIQITNPDYGIQIGIILVMISLRWTKTYPIFTPTIFHVMQMTRQLRLLTKCTLDEVYKLHLYKLPGNVYLSLLFIKE